MISISQVMNLSPRETEQSVGPSVFPPPLSVSHHFEWRALACEGGKMRADDKLCLNSCVRLVTVDKSLPIELQDFSITAGTLPPGMEGVSNDIHDSHEQTSVSLA